jgi:hypothetical protein
MFFERGFAMTIPSDPREAARGKAQKYFTQSEQRDTLVKQEIEKERAAIDAKTAKLRALRLAKEAADREEAAKLAASQPARNKAPAKRSVRKKRA